MKSTAAESQSTDVNHAADAVVSDRSIQVQLLFWGDDKIEELQQLREEVKMLRLKCQRTSGVMQSIINHSSQFVTVFCTYPFN